MIFIFKIYYKNIFLFLHFKIKIFRWNEKFCQGKSGTDVSVRHVSISNSTSYCNSAWYNLWSFFPKLGCWTSHCWFSFYVLLFVIHVTLVCKQEVSNKYCYCWKYFMHVFVFHLRYDLDWPYNFNVKLTRNVNNLKMVLQILFCHPPGVINDGISAQPIR